MIEVPGTSPVAVKCCGLTRPEDARVAEQAGARYLGVILAGGPRLVTPERAGAVLGVRRPGIQRVAVFGAQAPDEMLAIAEALDLDVLQLHGDPTARDVEALRRRTSRALWPVVRVAGTILPTGTAEVAAAAGALVLDAKVVGQQGGTGVPLDWAGLQDAVAELRAQVPGLRLVLAGGLRPSTVGTAIALLTPDVVDVSSGVETSPGVKDPSAIRDFVAAARAVVGNP